MNITGRIVAAVGLLSLSTLTNAATLLATGSNFASVFYAAGDGDRIVLSGSVGFLQLRYRNFAQGLTIDASNAKFTDTFQMKNISGVSFVGGTFGSTTAAMTYGQAVIIRGGSAINFTGSNFVGNGGGTGLAYTGSSNIAVRNSSFTGLGRGLAFTSISNGVMDGNRFLKSSSDGAAIVDSHFITATHNLCSGTVPAAGAHPDCFQLWSLAGNPVQSDIMIADNTAIGATQGFTSFDPARGGGLRISMLRNRVDTSYPQGIACYACVDSLIADNVLTTQAGARWKTTINVVGGSNNIVRNNSINAPPLGGSSGRALAAFGSDEADTLDALVPLSSSSSSAAAAVPEPLVWVQLLGGMAAVGFAMRRQRRPWIGRAA